MSTLPNIPNYELYEIAGEGGMGTVYRAKQDGTKRNVAVKMLMVTGKKAGRPDVAERFLEEGRIIAALEHPHILPIYDLGYTADTEQPYLIMRYLEGGSVADQLGQQGKIDVDTAVQWLCDIADALDLAHAQGLVHKDVKPSNMLLDRQGNVYLTDFGIAGMHDSGGRLVGSASYMAPEQGQGLATDGRTDVYALAVTLFELLTGEKPYMAETGLGVIVRHINDPIPDPRRFDPSISPAMADLIMWGMSKDAADRPQSAALFCHALQEARLRPIEPVRRSVSASDMASNKPNTTDTRPAALIWGGGIFIFLLLAAGFFVLDPLDFLGATGTSTPANVTGQSTVVVLPTAVPTSTPESQLFFDNFDVERVRSGDQDDAIALVDDTLVFETADNTVYATFNTGELAVQNGTIQVDLLPSSRAAEYDLLLSCRWQDQGNYTAFLMQVTAEQVQLFIIKLVDGETSILSRGELPGGMLDGVHALGASCQDAVLEFYLDNTVILTGEDLAPESGDIALMTRPLHEDQLHQIVFDNLLISK